jgi:hypothetical protein
LNALRASCCRRLASVSGLSLGCTLRLAACASLSFRVPEPLFFFSLLPGDSPLLDRQVSVLERKLFWKLALVVVGDVLDGG